MLPPYRLHNLMTMISLPSELAYDHLAVFEIPPVSAANFAGKVAILVAKAQQLCNNIAILVPQNNRTTQEALLGQ